MARRSLPAKLPPTGCSEASSRTPDANPRIVFDYGTEHLVLEGFADRLLSALTTRVFRSHPWEFRFAELEDFQAEHGHCNVPPRGSALGEWVGNQRGAYKRGQLSQARTERLEGLGFVWDLKAAEREEKMQALAAFSAEHGHCNVTASQDRSLSHFVNNLRRARKRGELSDAYIEELDQLGFTWNVFEERWNAMYSELERYQAREGHADVRQSSGKLGTWVSQQRLRYRKGTLPARHQELLDALGFVYDAIEFNARHGSSNSSRKLNDEAALAIYKDPRATKEIAEEYRASTATVQQIRRGKTWAHVTGHKVGLEK